MISSVPYVPPDTMKKVAATRGHSVSLATRFLVVGITREGYWAGSDNELNSYSRPPKRSSLSRCGEASSQLKNTRVVAACKNKMKADEIFFNSLPGLSYYSIAPHLFSSGVLNRSANPVSGKARARLLVHFCSHLILFPRSIPNGAVRPCCDFYVPVSCPGTSFGGASAASLPGSSPHHH